jgi:peptide-N4-(N-acetyl-beta-glucosaminyl)asparagine amidase
MTDHVWTEVYFPNWERWVHMDSCEASFDQPLLYEKGWGKQLTYVIAFSSKETADVTKRYVMDGMVNSTRRQKVNEKWLEDTLR